MFVISTILFIIQHNEFKDTDKQPRIYHKIEWMVDTQPQNPCSDSGDWNADYNVCMKGTLPRAMAGHFLLIGDELNLYKFAKEDTSNKFTSYIAECQGDSGSGHWVTVYEDTSSNLQKHEGDNTRRALVAVMSRIFKPKFLTPDGNEEYGICGGVHIDKSLNDKASGSIAMNTTKTEILKFIKKWAILCKDYNDQGNCVLL